MGHLCPVFCSGAGRASARYPRSESKITGSGFLIEDFTAHSNPIPDQISMTGELIINCGKY